MCGIAGFIGRTADDEGVLRAMTRSIRHRGPDAEGLYAVGNVHFGHRRLSVIDLAGSAQPMRSEDDTCVLVFNGEIYNFQALRTALQREGLTFATSGDTEVLLKGYQHHGTDVLSHLSGMFAFALWDETRRRLFLARDHLGVKPLYYYWDGSLFAFGSELKALMAHPGIRREVDPVAIGLYLECQYIPAPRTIYRNIHKLRPGYSLILEGGQLREERYWLPDYSVKPDLSEQEAADLVEKELRRSIQSQLVADVPVGAFVSGGIDSSLVAALMTDCLGRPVESFNLGFTGDALQTEHVQAAAVARHIGSHHHALMIDPSSVLDAFEQWVEIFDEPFGDQAALPTLLLSRLTRQHVTVALTGEGADEVFSGYSNYRKRVSEERLTGPLGAGWSPLRHLAPLLPGRLRKDRIIKALGRPLARRYVTIPNIFDETLRRDMLAPAFVAQLTESMVDYAERFYHECNSAHYIDRLMYVDSRLWLPDDLLTKVDRATMACSLEARVPYLDHEFFQACAQLDPKWKQRGRTQKYILKKVAEKYLPADIVHRNKQGFVMPLQQWLSGGLRAWVDEHLSEQGLLRRGLFRPGEVERMLSDHFAGRRNHSGRIWVLLVLELWFRRYEPDFVVGAQPATAAVH